MSLYLVTLQDSNPYCSRTVDRVQNVVLALEQGGKVSYLTSWFILTEK